MNIFQYYLDENHLKPGTKLKKGDEELKVVKPVGDDKYLVKEEDLDGALAYKQTHEKWGVVPKSKKEFVKFFDVNREAEARAHAAKTGGTLKKIDQMGRAIKEETIHVGHRNSKGDWVKTSTHSNYHDVKKAMAELEKQGKKGVQHRYDNQGSIEPGAMMKQKVDESGPFSYGAKAPRKGSVAYNALLKRKEQEKSAKPIEPKDQMSGAAKVTKEDVERIDELSKTTLSGYVAKASSSKMWHQDNAKYARQDQQDDIADEEEAKANKRKAGIKRAISKITKEAVDTYGKPLTEMKRAIAGAIAKRVAESARSEFSANMSMSSSSTPSSAKKYRLVHKKTGATSGVFASHSSAKSAFDNHPLKKHLVIEELTSEDLTQLD